MLASSAAGILELVAESGTMPLSCLPSQVKVSSMAKSGGGKTTSPKAATAASKVMRDGRTGDTSKTAAGSALAQKEAKPKGKGK